MKRHGIILFGHGARDARWAEPFERLAGKLRATRSDPVSLAFLELMTPSLPDEVNALVALGARDITIVPVFLGQGGHLLRDLPLLLDQLRASHPQATFRTVPAVGEDPGVLAAMAAYCAGAAERQPA